MPKLADIQRAILTAASRRVDGTLMPLPKSLRADSSDALSGQDSNSRHALSKARKSSSNFSSLRSETLAIRASFDWTSPRSRAVLVARRRMREHRALLCPGLIAGL